MSHRNVRGGKKKGKHWLIMLLPGHKSLLLSTLRRMSDDEIGALLMDADAMHNAMMNRKHLVSKKNKRFKSLVNGLYYPDLPCSSRTLRNGVVTHDTIKLCSLKKLLFFSANDHLHEAYASHNGSMAYLHAMAPTPVATVGRVRDSVVRQLLMLFAAGVRDETTVGLDRVDISEAVPNAFWLGQALHVLMDSYSPAHTLRVSSSGTVEKNASYADCIRTGVTHMKAYAEHVWNVKVSASDKLAMRVYDIIQHLAHVYVHWSKLSMRGSRPNDDVVEDWLIAEVQRELVLRKPRGDNDPTYTSDILAYMQRKNTRAFIIDAFEVFVFEGSIDDKYGISQVIKSLKSKRTPKDPAMAQDRAIMCFFNYNTQSKLMHMRNDLMSSVKKQDLKKVCVEQCLWFIRRYIDTVKSVSACQSASAAVRKLRRELSALAGELVNGPLQILHGFDGALCIVTPDLTRECRRRSS